MGGVGAATHALSNPPRIPAPQQHSTHLLRVRRSRPTRQQLGAAPWRRLAGRVTGVAGEPPPLEHTLFSHAVARQASRQLDGDVVGGPCTRLAQVVVGVPRRLGTRHIGLPQHVAVQASLCQLRLFAGGVCSGVGPSGAGWGCECSAGALSRTSAGARPLTCALNAAHTELEAALVEGGDLNSQVGHGALAEHTAGGHRPAVHRAADLMAQGPCCRVPANAMASRGPGGAAADHCGSACRGGQGVGSGFRGMSVGEGQPMWPLAAVGRNGQPTWEFVVSRCTTKFPPADRHWGQ